MALPKILENPNMDVFSLNMSTTVMKLGTILLCSKAYQIVSVWVTFVQSHGQRGRWKILENSNMDIFSCSMSTADMKLGHIVPCGKVFQTMSVRVTFIQSHIHIALLKILGKKPWPFSHRV